MKAKKMRILILIKKKKRLRAKKIQKRKLNPLRNKMVK